MNVGITYDLKEDYIKEGYTEEEVLEFDKPETIAGIENALIYLGYKTIRIGNIKSLVTRLNNGERWDMVFNIAEGLKGIGREAEVPALLEAYNIPYTFSDPLVLSLSLHKAMAKRVIRDAGILTPDFILIESLDDLKSFYLTFPVFAKPVAEGTSKGINKDSKINNKSELEKTIKEMLLRYKQPVIIEEFLPGREFTVGIIGTGSEAKAIGALEILLNSNAEADIYSHTNKAFYEDRVEYKAASDESANGAIELALKVWKVLGARDAGRVDVRIDRNGNPGFIEINPLAGLNPDHSDLPILCSLVGTKYVELIDRIMKSALTRV